MDPQGQGSERAADDIGGEGDPGDARPDALHQGVVRGARVAAPHAGQHGAGSALSRHVQLLAHVGAPRDDLAGSKNAVSIFLSVIST